jgi:hypothetical protein
VQAKWISGVKNVSYMKEMEASVFRTKFYKCGNNDDL